MWKQAKGFAPPSLLGCAEAGPQQARFGPDLLYLLAPVLLARCTVRGRRRSEQI